MTQWHGRSKRKKSGGKLKFARGKRRYEIGCERTYCVCAEPRYKIIRARSNHKKVRLLSSNIANVYDKKSNKIVKTKIITVKENTANPHYVHRNILTKGAVIQTQIGLAKITSRPGQDGVINAVLI